MAEFYRKKKKVCQMCAGKDVDYKNIEVIKKEGYIANYEVLERELKNHRLEKYILVTLKYTDKKERVIKGLTRISKPGLRIYAKASEMPKVFNGLGTAIVSTSNGVMTDREARKQKVGGEVMAYIW